MANSKSCDGKWVVSDQQFLETKCADERQYVFQVRLDQILMRPVEFLYMARYSIYRDYGMFVDYKID